MFVKTTAVNWHTTKGRELLRLVTGAEQAEVIAAKCGEADLRALAAACLEAADQIAASRTEQAQAA